MKEIIKYYILGYLNTYYIAVKHLKGKGITYKEHKLAATAAYMGISKRNIFLTKILFPSVSFFETPLSVIIVAARFLHSSTCWFFTKKCSISNGKLLLGAGEIKTKQIINNTNLDKRDIRIVLIPYVSQNIYSGFKCISIFSGIKFIDIITAFIYSLRTIFIISNKYGKRDVALRSYSSFEFYLGYFYIKRSNISNTFLFTSTYSRWAYLHGNIEQETIFLQHGWLSTKTLLLKKIGSVNSAYYLSPQQQSVCERCLFYNKPHAFYLKGIEFTFKPDNDKINVLLISEFNHRERELKIIEDFCSNNKLRLFVKPHPKDKDIDVFEKLNEQKGFVLLQGYNFPQVDYVISYESTLAVEYEVKGIRVLLYTDSDFDEEYTKLLSIDSVASIDLTD